MQYALQEIFNICGLQCNASQDIFCITLHRMGIKTSHPHNSIKNSLICQTHNYLYFLSLTFTIEQLYYQTIAIRYITKLVL